MFPSRQWKGDFELSLDVDRIPPEELTVKAEGRKLIVVGQHNEKKETPDGGIVEEHREWHREADLPEDVNPRDVLCSMSRDGRLHFRAPRLAQPEAKYRIMPVNRVIHIPIMLVPGSRSVTPLPPACKSRAGNEEDSMACRLYTLECAVVPSQNPL
uniref:SHSP domain-containing protein n=1 Tax=Pyxicephalus adspersus TaxID=30357 RepID=A0AAV2ZHB7_PYXAD|nr:TPA: hypothetical protein GDO54_003970 [Pyxicephalus adspersus]